MIKQFNCTIFKNILPFLTTLPLEEENKFCSANNSIFLSAIGPQLRQIRLEVIYWETNNPIQKDKIYDSFDVVQKNYNILASGNYDVWLCNDN